MWGLVAALSYDSTWCIRLFAQGVLDAGGGGCIQKLFGLKDRPGSVNANVPLLDKYISKNFFRKPSLPLLCAFVYQAIAGGIEDTAHVFAQLPSLARLDQRLHGD